MDDEYDWDGEPVVDLDACGGEATGDRRIDETGYQSPRLRGQNLTGFTHTDHDFLAQARRDREQREQRRRAAVQAANIEASRQRTAARRGQVQPQQPPAHVAAAVERGAPGREAGWWRVDIAADGSARWVKVDAPGDGPWITATTPAPQPPAPQWHPVEQTQPSPGTVVW